MVLIYIVKEISPLSLKGMTASLHQLWVMGGVLLSYLIGYSLPLNKNTRVMWMMPFTIPLAVSVICCCLLRYHYIYDSPLYYISKSDGRYKVALSYIYNDKIALAEALSTIEKENAEMKALNITWKELCNKYFKNILIIALIATFNQINGINAIRYHSTAMFEFIGVDKSKSRIYTLIMGIALVAAPLFSMATSDSNTSKQNWGESLH
jgi:hypothetical protein